MLVTTAIVALALAGIAMSVNAVVRPGRRKRSDQSQHAVPAPRERLVFHDVTAVVLEALADARKAEREAGMARSDAA